MTHTVSAETKRRLLLGLVNPPPHRNRRRRRKHDHFSAVIATMIVSLIARLFKL